MCACLRQLQNWREIEPQLSQSEMLKVLRKRRLKINEANCQNLHLNASISSLLKGLLLDWKLQQQKMRGRINNETKDIDIEYISLIGNVTLNSFWYRVTQALSSKIHLSPPESF